MCCRLHSASEPGTDGLCWVLGCSFAGTLQKSIRPMITLMMFVSCGVVIIASIMYYVERGQYVCSCSSLRQGAEHTNTLCAQKLKQVADQIRTPRIVLDDFMF